MKILMIGAGVLGANLAHDLKKQHDLTLLVRGDTYKTLSVQGLVIRHKPLEKRTCDHFPLITELAPSEVYDLILVPVRYNQLGSTLEMIRQNASKTVLFIGNNMTAEQVLLPGKHVLFGFFQAAGYRHDSYVDSICIHKITAGQLLGDGSHDKFLHDLFDRTDIRLKIENRMGDWLKTHGVSILPLVFACYQVDGNLRGLSKNREYSLKLIQAVKEGYDVLRNLGYTILPEGEYETTRGRQRFCSFLYRFLFSNWIGQTCISDHAMHAADELEQILEDFIELRNQSGIETPVFDTLWNMSGFYREGFNKSQKEKSLHG